MNNKKYIELIDQETGEIEEGLFIPKDQIDKLKITDKQYIEKYKQHTQRVEKLKEYNKTVGEYFTFSLRDSVKELFSNELFNDTEKVSIMYIGTFVNSKGYLITKNNIHFDKKLLKKYVKITTKDNAYNIFYDKLIESGILLEQENKLVWNTKLSFKGSPGKQGNSIKDCYRTYDQTLQKLYEDNMPKSLAVIFRLLPYVNRYTNELSRIVDDIYYDKEELYSPYEIAVLLGIHGETEKKDFIRRSLKIRVGDDFIFMISKVNKQSKVTINPSLVWMSGEPPHFTMLNLFEAAKEKYLQKKNKKKLLH